MQLKEEGYSYWLLILSVCYGWGIYREEELLNFQLRKVVFLHC
jgi:hypothetical protein